MCNYFLSMLNYVTGKGCLTSFTLAFVFLFFDYQSKHFPISLRQFKIYVADWKPQTIISFFPVYTKLYYRKRGLNKNSTHKLSWCWIIQVVTFLEKKSMITLASEVWKMEPNTNNLFHPTLLSCDHPFSNGLHFLNRDLGPYSPIILKNILCLCLQDLQIWM